MRKLLNTLFITTDNAYLTRDGLNVVIKIDNVEKHRFPIHTLEGIITFSYAGASPALMEMCAENNVGLTFCNEYGKFLARVSGKVKGNVLLRKQQYRVADDEPKSAKIAVPMLQAKLINCATVIKRALRDHAKTVDGERLNFAALRLTNAAQQLQNVDDLATLRGIEGEAATNYFGVFNELILSEKEIFRFNGRNKRPPLDPVNALLSFAYTMLAHDMQSALESVGLDPYVGFLHRDRPGRISLALDLMEELRPVISDRLVLSLINRKQVAGTDFQVKENGSVLLSDTARKEILATLHQRKQEEIFHPYLDEKIKVGLLPYAQAMLLARFLRGDIDGYPPYFWR